MTVIYAVIEFYGTEEAEVVGLFSTMKLAEDLKKGTSLLGNQRVLLGSSYGKPPWARVLVCESSVW